MMWTEQEQALFTQTNRYIVNGQYLRGLATADELLDLITRDDRKWAYISGCLRAVALRHVGRQQEAQEVFSAAYQCADDADEPVIAAYIRVDWSSEEPDPYRAIDMVQQAILACEAADYTPDPQRSLAADIAFFRVILAVHTARAGMQGVAPYILIDGRRALKRHAYGNHPSYRGAYLVTLMYEWRLIGLVPTWATLARWALAPSRITFEVVRQRRIWATMSLLASSRRRKRLEPSEWS